MLNVPDIRDVDGMLRILTSLGAKVKRDGNSVEIIAATLDSSEIGKPLASELRSSIFLLGAVLGRVSKAKVAYPGGCAIGARPIDVHLKALADMNVKIKEEDGCVVCDAEGIKPAEIALRYPSVGATENVMLAGARIDGVTTVYNAAKEPEVVDLARFLNKVGANIEGAGTRVIRIGGNPNLHGAEHRVIPDRIAVGTYMIATAVCGGRVEITGARASDLRVLIAKLKKCGCKAVCKNGNIIVEREGALATLGRVKTMPYPAFPTDLQAPICALAAVSGGMTVVTETVFETRFKHLSELGKMGANVRTVGRVAYIEGVEKLHGANVTATDLRGGAGLVIAGLAAQGVTTVDGVEYIERGYENLVENLGILGADIYKE